MNPKYFMYFLIVFLIIFTSAVFVAFLSSNPVLALQDKCYVGDNEVSCPDDKSIESNVITKDIPLTKVNNNQNRNNNNINDPTENRYNNNPQLSSYYPGTIGEEWNGNLDILPEYTDKFVQNGALFVSIFIIIILLFAALDFFKAKLFGKTLIEYILPVKYYMLVAVLIAITQYLIIGLPVVNTIIKIPALEQYSVVLRLTQAAWALMVALSVRKVVKGHNFDFKNVVFLGVLYSFAIHGLKVSIRHFFYGRPIYYLLDRFLYGSLLVMAIVIPLGLLFVYLKKKNVSF